MEQRGARRPTPFRPGTLRCGGPRQHRQPRGSPVAPQGREALRAHSGSRVTMRRYPNGAALPTCFIWWSGIARIARCRFGNFCSAKGAFPSPVGLSYLHLNNSMHMLEGLPRWGSRCPMLLTQVALTSFATLGCGVQRLRRKDLARQNRYVLTQRVINTTSACRPALPDLHPAHSGGCCRAAWRCAARQSAASRPRRAE